MYEGATARLRPSQHRQHDRATRAGTGWAGAGSQGAHLFRHSLATRLLRHGASLPEIGLVLRHRTVQTTEIYAKVDVAGLRALAQPWPEIGGVR